MRRSAQWFLPGLAGVLCLPAAGQTAPLATTPTLQPYGILNLTLTADTGMPPPQAQTPAEAANKNDLYDVTARNTILGVRLSPTELEGLAVGGRVEVDFLAGSNSSPAPRLRHCYFTLGTPDGTWEMLAGKSYDILDPWNMGGYSINFPADNWPGDIGLKRPQLRLTYKNPLGQDRAFTWQLALTTFEENITSSEGVATEQIPALESHLGVDLPFLAKQTASLGLSGHFGAKRHASDTAQLPNSNLETWSIGADAKLPFGKSWTFITEVWRAKLGNTFVNEPSAPPTNLGATQAAGDAYISHGGMALISYTPSSAWRFNAGKGLQKIDQQEVNPGRQTRIDSWFVNGYWTLADKFEIGLETSQWRSTFAQMTDANDDLRIQLSLSYYF